MMKTIIFGFLGAFFTSVCGIAFALSHEVTDHKFDTPQSWKSIEKSDIGLSAKLINAKKFVEHHLKDDPKAAFPPLQFLKKQCNTHDSCVDGYSSLDLDLLTEYARVKKASHRRQNVQKILSIAEQRHATNQPYSHLVTHAIIEMGEILLSQSKYEDAELILKPLTLWMSSSESSIDSGMMNKAFLTHGKARLNQIPYTKLPDFSSFSTMKEVNEWSEFSEKALEARILFSQALVEQQVQKSIEEFDQIYADLLTWEAFAISVFKTLRHAQPDLFSYDGFNLRPMSGPSFGDRDLVEPCKEIKWIVRQPMEYPEKYEKKQQPGVVLLGYHIDEQGEVVGERVLSEMPNKSFSPYLLKAMKAWKADVTDQPAACRENKILLMKFQTG